MGKTSGFQPWIMIENWGFAPIGMPASNLQHTNHKEKAVEDQILMYTI